MKRVSFGVSRIQALRRVTLDENLLRNLNLAEGDAVEVFLDAESEEIVLTKVAPASGNKRQSEGDSSPKGRK